MINFKTHDEHIERVEDLCNVFFELSHEDRMKIMLTFQREGGVKLTSLSKTLDATTQEVYRHVSRLQKAKLVMKNVAGDYQLTSVGEQALRWVPGYRFLSAHSDYFMSHTLSVIPEEYTLRLGDLENSEFTNDVMITMFDNERMIKEAEEYIWMIMDQMMMNLYEPIKDALQRGVQVHVMRPKGWQLAEDVKKHLSDELIKALFEYNTTGKLQQREPERIDLCLFMSEKQVSSLSFITLEGKHDYIAFKSTDPVAHKWGREIYEHYWETATPAQIRV
ncbi:hypothetical protein DRO31_04820 [Candidatus Bathyarchaeota archaeon]|nr:MAG: hypothetical protein DRO31_04820 [Candidatus Bathyarchaeota archaeon]